jgi:putative transposase
MGDHLRGRLDDWTLALGRECVVRPLAESGRPTKEGVQLAMVQLGLGRSVLYKLLRRYRQRPQTSSLLPWKRGRGREKSLLNLCEFHWRGAFLVVVRHVIDPG